MIQNSKKQKTLQKIRDRKSRTFLGFRILDFGFSREKRGMYLPVIMLASVMLMAFATAIISIALSKVKMANLHNKKITAMSISEAGINYYMWHLAHNNTDYCDGQTCPAKNSDGSYGAFHHNFTDQSGTTLGTYDLYITPPNSSSSSVFIKSVGKVSGKSPTKIIVSEIGMPSFTKYGLLVDGNDINLGTGGKIEGSVFANNGKIYNQGEITGDASSTEQDGVVTLSGGVYGGAKLSPVPPIDFNHLNIDIAKLKDDAKNGINKGDYFPSSSSGYHIILKANSYDIYRVTKYDATGFNVTKETLVTLNHAYPEYGVIFCEDNVWVEGAIDHQKVTIIAADPDENGNNRKKMYITNPVKYTSKDGTDKIGLISQTGIYLAKTAIDAANNMEIDAALIAEDGDIGINNYGVKRNKLTLYGSMAAQQVYWKYTQGNNVFVSGFASRDMIQDQFNVLNPPPKFPLTGTYSILSWREE